MQSCIEILFEIKKVFYWKASSILHYFVRIDVLYVYFLIFCCFFYRYRSGTVWRTAPKMVPKRQETSSLSLGASLFCVWEEPQSIVYKIILEAVVCDKSPLSLLGEVADLGKGLQKFWYTKYLWRNIKVSF